MSKFDHCNCNLTKFRVFLNSSCYPYDNLCINFEHEQSRREENEDVLVLDFPEDGERMLAETSDYHQIQNGGNSSTNN
ncbi:hypothetical protein NQ315_003999 [Exocentrus adspersus]|uniref:Double jelly roll-like domain-containing protein n=1 Tax=Exocentrus adspersus TaxID=1586481 RepID=A0AAV8V5Q0_9CUCU|nr:hypothetical protein NQ315_003999 [Exocentrus adspersus]